MNSISDCNSFIQVKNLHLVFRTDYYRANTWKDAFVQGVRHSFKRSKPTSENLPILKNINFTVRSGERVGIIGVNGTGKTSLCRCVAGVYQPTSGHIRLKGKVHAIFDTHVGMLPELTGRENAKLLMEFLYPEETEKKKLLEEALEFSEIGKFLETPYKNYSNGMKTRLCLSLISSKPSDILILDEVFEGADQFFSLKISDRILKMINKSGLVLFVSHSLEIIEKVCNRVILLNDGQIIYDGAVSEGLKIYSNLCPNNKSEKASSQWEQEIKNLTEYSSELESKIEGLNHKIVLLEKLAEEESQGNLGKKLGEQFHHFQKKFLNFKQEEFLSNLGIYGAGKSAFRNDITPRLQQHESVPNAHLLREYFLSKEELERESESRGLGPGLNVWEMVQSQFLESTEITVSRRAFYTVLHRQASYQLKNQYRVNEKNGFITAPGPAKVHPDCKYSIEFAAQVVSDHYEKDLSFEFLAESIVESGLEMDVNILKMLNRNISIRVLPIVQKIKQEILSDFCAVHIDSAPWRILQDNITGRLWVASNRVGAYYYFDSDLSVRFAEGLSREVSGAIVCDGINGYDQIKGNGRLRAQHCWDFVRRELLDKSRNMSNEVDPGLRLIHQLFELEGNCSSVADLVRLRCTEEKEIVYDFFKWCKEAKDKQHEYSMIGHILQYCIDRWDGLTHFLTDLAVPLSNRDAVDALEFAAVGRKRLFNCQKLEDVEAMTNLYTLIVSCKKNGLKTKEYFQYLLTEQWLQRELKTPLELSIEKFGPNERVLFPSITDWKIQV